MKSTYVTVEEMAEMASVAPNTIYRILRADQDKLPELRRIPGAFKRGSKYRGEWLIPRDTAESWRRDGRGRKSVRRRASAMSR
jgi:predicted transcriptional regulator